MNLEDLLKEPLEYPHRQEVDALVKEAMDCLPANRTDLISRVSHSIRTPLAAILGFKEVMELENAVSDEDREKYRAIVQAEKHRLRRFIKTLQTFRLLTAGKLKLNLSTHDLRKVVAEAVSRCDLDAKSKNIRIDVIRQSTELAVSVDQDLLCLAIEHILLNAIRASFKDGIINIEFLVEKDRIRVIVEDSGHGMDPAQTEQLFKPFHRVPQPDDNGGEMGLGLTIARSVAERHQGTLEATSVPMEGSTITLTIPL